MVGNIPNFSKIDILRCFLRLNKSIGRKDLARALELGEGTVRTILNTLKFNKLLDSTKRGHFLNKRGIEKLKEINECIGSPKSLIVQNIYPEFIKVGILIKNASDIRNLYKLRDIAVKNGAEGAIILKYEAKLYAPESDYEQDYKEIEKFFDFHDNDILVIAFSNKNRTAEIGAFAVAIELSTTLRKFINEL